MTEFRLHQWVRGPGAALPTANIEAGSSLHGAALALREFTLRGHDITAPGTHLDASEASGPAHMMMIEEVLDWLHQPEQADFVKEHNLTGLLDLVPPSRI